MRRRLPITVLLAAAVSLPALLVAGVLFLVSYSIAEKNTAELTRDKAQLLLDNLVGRIEAHLRPVAQIGAALEGELVSAAGIADPALRQARVLALLGHAKQGFGQLSGLAWVQGDGSVYRVLEGEGAAMSDSLPPDHPDVRAFLEDAKDRAGGYWGDFVLPAADSAPLMNYRLPVRRGGELLGVLGLGVSIEDLSLYLQELADEGGPAALGTPFILLGRDRVVAHPLLQWNFPGLTSEEPLPGLLAFPDPVLSALFTGETREPPANYRSELYEVRLFALGALSYVGFFVEVGGYSDIPFTVGTVVETSQVDEQIRRLDLLPAIATGLVLLALLGGVFLGRSLARPIKRLQQGARRIQTLELEGHAGFGRSAFRELDDAQRAFDAMIGGLKLFALYVPKGLVRRLMQAGLFQGPESEERHLTIMFTDIVGFTGLSEAMPASAVSALLNEHFALLGRAVEAEGGTIDKYIGDALMAFWGAPEPLPDPETRAARAALAIAAALEADNERRRALGQAPLQLRIGLHAGPVVVGNIGSPERVNYTIIGDPVNSCQRLEALGKEIDPAPEEACVILISDAVRSALGDAFQCEDLGESALRGRSEGLRVYRLLSGPRS